MADLPSGNYDHWLRYLRGLSYICCRAGSLRGGPFGIHCSFCGKEQGEVAKLIAGPEVYICDECIDLCNEIVKDEDAAQVSDEDTAAAAILKPMDINDHLNDYVIGQDFAKESPRCSCS